MIEVLRKIWRFAGEEQGNIRKSMVLGFFYAIFHMFQIGAIYVVVLALVDGSTSAAPAWEALVQRAVGKLVAGRTVLVIAHRLSTITGADQIVVVNGGRIEATGKHEKLLETCPLYREMWQAHMGVKEGEQA